MKIMKNEEMNSFNQLNKHRIDFCENKNFKESNDKLSCGRSNDQVHVNIRSTKRDKIPLQLVTCFILLWFVSFTIIYVFILRNDYIRKHFFTDTNTLTNETIFRQKHNLESISQFDNNEKNSGFSFPLIIKLLDEKGTTNVNKEWFEEQVCTPQQNVVFLKTHKTASSTVTNILNRYADLRELTVVLPAMGDLRFAWPRKFHWSSVDLLRLDGQPANMLVNHARYDRQQMNMVMEDNSKYITILRNPISQFESSFYYFEFNKYLHLNKTPNAIEEFLSYPDEYLYNLTIRLNDLPDTMNLIQSGMFYDLGYDFMDVENNFVIGNILKKLERDFSLVLITEYFDESLVLLKNELCWEFDDILYIKQNERLNKAKKPNAWVREKIKKWNHADVMLYQHFNKTLWKKIKKYGSNFWIDVKEFKRRNDEFTKICSPKKITTKGYKINVDVTSFVMNPKVDKYNRYLCEKLLMTEVDYLAYFRKKFGNNYGYQRILVAEGIKPLHRRKRLQERLKKMHIKSPKFFMPGEIRKS